MQSAEPDHTGKKTFGYEPALDGIRAIAVLLVMANHTGLAHAGRLGVDIFFVLSGYLITAILISEFRANDRINLKKFYARRALRLLPALILLLIVVNVCVVIFQTHKEAAMVRWYSLGALFYIANWLRAFGHDMGILGHLWSLSIEEQFYFFWPIALIFFWSLRLRAYQMIMLVAFAVVLVNLDRIYLYNGIQSWNRIYNGLDTRADALLIGCALGLSGWQILSRRVWAVLGALGATFAVYVLFEGYPVPTESQILLELTVGGTFFALAVAFVLAGVLSHPDAFFAKALRFPPLVWSGRLSYGLYLWHYFVFAFITGWFRKSEPLRLLPLQVFATFVCATISYYLLERPFLKLKKQFSVIKTIVPTSPSPLEAARR
jgi:peptidoglycan/LPS O-acetylase OafA/YrhL